MSRSVKNRVIACLAACVSAACLSVTAPGAEEKEAEAKKENAAPLVLDTFSYWRSFIVTGKAVYAEKAADVKPEDAGPFKLEVPSDWAQPGFDDAEWYRRQGSLYGGYGWLRRGGPSPEIAMICMRGKFAVTDPSAVKELTLSVSYRGGVVVYLNGKEVARQHLPEGELTAASMAEEYPLESYINEKGKGIHYSGGKSEEENKRLATRIRHLKNVSVPVAHLRKGVNVLAIEVHRSPIRPDRKKDWKTLWSTPGFQSVELRAAPGGAEPNLFRPAGVQVWNEDAMTGVSDIDYGSPNEPLIPVRIVGTRNGTFSVQAVLGFGKELVKPQAKMSELKLAEGEGVIAADQMRIRWALPTDGWRGGSFRGVSGVKRFNALAEKAPEKVALLAKRTWKRFTGPAAKPGAVQPVWVTVKVPADAVPGKYTGTLTLSAEGIDPIEVPVELSVADWVMPDCRKFASHVGIINSPESEAMYYKKEMWSDEHWKLVARSMRIMGEAGTNCLFIPLVAKHHFGKYGMVRWIKKDDGYEYDFTLFDKYVDLALEHLGTLQVVCLYAWEPKYAAGSRHNRKKENTEKQTAPVNTLNRETGEVGEMPSPFYIAPEAADFWKPVMEACRERLLKKGISEKALMVGMASDRHPGEGEVKMFKKAAPWATWIKQAHGRVGSFYGVKVGHLAFVWGTHGLKDPSEKRGKGWKVDSVFTVFPRAGACRTLRAGNLMSEHYTMQEYMIAAGYRGVGRIGADFWPVVPGQNNHYGGATLAGAFASWGQTTISESVLDLLYPGPEGAEWTLRLETYRQGVQEAEARIFIEKALDDPAAKAKLGDELAKRAQDLLDARARRMLAYAIVPQWYPGSSWQESSVKLYATAAEVAAAIAK